MIPVLATLTLVCVNAFTVFVFWFDKQRALTGGWRVSEANLLFCAVIGGSPGALFARRAFRHKTRKEPFGTILLLICMVQLGTAIGFGLF